MQRGLLIAVMILLGLGLVTTCTGFSSYNGLVAGQEDIKAKAAIVDVQYTRRADLIPQLVATVKGAADFEQTTLTELTEARASAGRAQMPANLTSDPEAMQAYYAAQAKVGSALTRFFAVAESYPQLGATNAFRDLQSQIEGTENRIAVAGRDFIEAVQGFNTRRRKFPGVVLAGLFDMAEVPQPEAEPVKRELPVVDFGADG
ncbi:MAG: LemA family protein [Planctomycetota bacterium]|nr:MAG: LemA family protein [Planctomycetota bacterium]